jgi:hypothetical protein
MQKLTRPTLRPRGSKLGESLYCIGDCRKVLPIDQFPVDSLGVCKRCVHAKTNEQSQASLNHYDLDPEHSLRDNFSWHNQRLSRVPHAHTKSRRSYHTYENGSEQPSRLLQRNRHSTLSSSTTAFSDIGGYNSGRSIYGVTRPSQKKGRKR